MILSVVYSMRSLFFSMVFLFMGNAILVASAGLLLNNMGASNTQVGLVAASYYLGGLISTITSHRIVSHVGHIRSFAIFSSLLAAFGLMHVLFESINAWIIFRFVLGYSYHALLMIIESWLNTRATNDIRSRVLGIYAAVYYLSFGLGVLILGLSLNSIKTLAIAHIFLIFCVIPISLIRVKEPSLPAKMKISLPNVFATSRLGFMTSIIAGMIVNSYSAMSGIYMIKLGYTGEEFSRFLALALFGGFIGQNFVGAFSDKYGRKIAILTTSSIGFALAFLMFIFTNLYVHYVLSFFFGMNVFCLYALALARASDQAKEGQIVEVGRTILFGFSLGSVISPVVVGELMEIFGHYGFMGFYASILACLALFASTRQIIPQEQRRSFEKQPVTIVNVKEEDTKEN